MEIKEIIEGLKEGKTLLYPTDTIWGIGCDAKNEKAIEKIFEIKQRPKEKSMIILVDSVPMLERYVKNFPEVCYDLIDFAVKPLTIIYEEPSGLAKNALADDGSIGIRVTNDPICRKIIQGLRGPLISTSANISGEPSPKNFNEVSEKIKKGVDMILNQRTNEQMTAPSSIIRVGNDASIQIIRK